MFFKQEIIPGKTKARLKMTAHPMNGGEPQAVLSDFLFTIMSDGKGGLFQLASGPTVTSVNRDQFIISEVQTGEVAPPDADRRALPAPGQSWADHAIESKHP